ncbi:hypothetical protein M6B38_143540 [Iris pallida]|uniref:Uncharacterized protein n=1 Tax=Iris pallida TaxID=29817 RepID=A0AAX6FAJ1_IRIPA|nr:hypothetical protein M6B38_143540 [Iris pallida]
MKGSKEQLLELGNNSYSYSLTMFEWNDCC